MNSFSHNSRGSEVRDQDVGRVGFFLGFSLWFAGYHLLCLLIVSSLYLGPDFLFLKEPQLYGIRTHVNDLILTLLPP